jgi:hypothetical protein
MESDWRKFSEMAPKLRERYLAEQNARIVALLADPKKNETERFWNAMEVMERETKILRRCLDGHSRSSMQRFMLSMIGVGMLKKEDMAVFSEELRNQIGFAFEERM